MKVYENITTEFQDWIQQQHVFFVATAPTRKGHVNLSPKGYNGFRILDENTVCYMDMLGSGNETSAHILENGRLTVMFCAFEGAPRTLRLYGRGEVLLPDDAKYQSLLATHYDGKELPGTRQIILTHVHRIQISCGKSVPYMDFKEDRTTLADLWSNLDKDKCHQYQRENNTTSIDGLPTPTGFKDKGVAFLWRHSQWRNYLVVVVMALVAVGVAGVLDT